MIQSDFCVFILTHGRPDRVRTFDLLRRIGYSGRLYIVIDDEDKTADEYRQRFGDLVLQFNKAKTAKTFDEADNFDNRRAIIYARNVCFELARQVGCRYFLQLDDDYTDFYIRFDRRGNYISARVTTQADRLFDVCLAFLRRAKPVTFCISQGGDHIGGAAPDDPIRLLRKTMNTFFCDVERPFQFHGRINEDVNTYTAGGRRGELFLTAKHAQVNQLQTQSNAGGMTETYIESGTYLKTFYSVMFCPSAVKVGQLGDNRSPHFRIHHRVNWNACAAKILDERWRKASGRKANQAHA